MAVSVTSASLSSARSLSSSLMVKAALPLFIFDGKDDFVVLVLPSLVLSLRLFSAGRRVSAVEYLTGFFCCRAASVCGESEEGD